MLGLKLKVDEFCQAVIQDKIDAGALNFKKAATGIVLFYAGPTENIVNAVCAKHPPETPDDHDPNWKTAKTEAERLNARRLDDTFLFDYLMSPDFDKDIIAATGATGRHRKEAKKLVWDYASDKFAHTDFREAATLICGAADNSSFVLKEMLGMLDGTHLEILDKRPANLFRDFKSLGEDEVRRLMCMTYLLDMRSHAKATKDAEAIKRYKRQRAYFLEWRRGKKTEFKAKPKDVRLAFRQARGEILARYNGGAGAGPAAPSVVSIPSLPKPANTP